MEAARRITRIFLLAISLNLLVVLAPTNAAAQQTDLGFGTGWLMLGPYTRDVGGATPGLAVIRQDYLTDGMTVTENGFIPTPGAIVNTNYAVAASSGYMQKANNGWPTPTVITWDDGDDSIFPIEPYPPGRSPDTMIYAWTWAKNKTASPLPCYLAIWSCRSVQVKVNGSEVGILNINFGWTDSDVVQYAWPVTLNPGDNLVMVKIFKGTLGEGFRLRFQTDGGTGLASPANSIPRSQLDLLVADSLAVANRTITGVGIADPTQTVQVVVTRLSGLPNPTVVEVPPIGGTVSNVTATTGSANYAAGRITWTVGNMSDDIATMTYQTTAVGYSWCSGTITSGVPFPVSGDDAIFQASPIGLFDAHGNTGIPPMGSFPGDPAVPGGASFSIGTYSVTGGGEDIFETVDRCYMLVRRMPQLNFIAQADVQWTSLSANLSCKATLMIRDSVSGRSPRAFASLMNPARAAAGSFLWRSRHGGPTLSGSLVQSTTQPARLRMVRRGNELDGYCYTTAGQWQRFPGSPQVLSALSATSDVLLAFGVTSHVFDSSATAQMTNLVITPLPVAAATRQFSQLTLTSEPVIVSIGLKYNAPSNPLIVTDVVPASWTISNPNPPGATINGTTITWTLASFMADTTLTYAATPPMPLPGLPQTFSGVVRDQYDVLTDIGGDSTVSPEVLIFQQGLLPTPSYTGCADTHIILYTVNSNTGAHNFIEEGDWNGGTADNKLIVTRFDISSVPRDKLVRQAFLKVFYYRERSTLTRIDHYLYGHMIAKTWGEGTGTGFDGPQALTGECSWNSARHAIESWQVAGCRGLTDIKRPTDFQARSTAQIGVTTGVWVTLDIAPFVRHWLANPSQNFGVKLSQDSTGYGGVLYVQGAYDFCSAQYATPGFRPMLVIEAAGALSRPTTLTAVAISSRAINLAWADNSNNEQGFKIERKTGVAGAWAEVATVGANATTSTNTGLSPTATYYYRVCGYIGTDISSYSNETSATTMMLNPPAAPSGLTAAAVSSYKIDLAWADSSNNELGFKVERRIAPTGPWSEITTVPANVMIFGDYALSPDTTYDYRVRAYNDDGNSAYSNAASATTMLAPPSQLTVAAVSASEIQLMWIDNSTDELGFKIERKTGPGGTWGEIASVGPNVVSHADSGLSPSTLFFYRVCAYNAAGNSSWSNEASAVTSMVPPSAPSNLTATMVSASRINLAWNDNANNEQGFQIERKTGATGAWAQIASVAADSTTYEDSGLMSNATYYYRLCAHNTAGDSPYSNEADATIPPNPRLQSATISDLNNNGIIEAGDQLVLTLDRSVSVTTPVLRASHFFLAVEGDSLGSAGFAVGVNSYNSRLIILTLGGGMHLATSGTFSMQNRTFGSPSGIDFATSLPAGSVMSLDGVPAVDSGTLGVDDSGIDVELSMIGRTANLGAVGGTLSVVASPEATYTHHELDIPAGALTTTTQFTLRPPVENLGVINAVQIESSSPTITFAAAVTVRVQYQEGDIDWERGQLESNMRVNQLVENPLGVYRYVIVPGEQIIENAAPLERSSGRVEKLYTIPHRVSVEVSSLNPCGSIGVIGIFAGLPIETVDERTINIKPEGGGEGMMGGAGSAVLMPGPLGAYALHRIEFPGYIETGTTDPLRLLVTIRSAKLSERWSLSGGQSFPSQSGAIFTVTVTNASDQPVRFTSPVHLTVQFKVPPDPAAPKDLVYFEGQPASAAAMRVVNDWLAGDPVDFVFADAPSQTVNLTQGTVTAWGLVGLTGTDGRGTFGAVARHFSTRTIHWPLYH